MSDEPVTLMRLVPAAPEAVMAAPQAHPGAALVDALVDPFYALDQDWRVTLFNRAAEEHFGLDRSAVLGRSIWELFPEEAGGEFDRRFREARATGLPIDFETASVARADSFVQFRVFPYEGGVAISFRNVTPIRRTEAALRESQARLEIATAAAEIGIWDWNLVTNEMIYSERAKAIYGLPAGEPATFQQVRDATHPEDYPRTSAMARRATDPALRERIPYEYRIVRPSDGEERWLVAHGEAIFSRIGDVERAVRYVGTIQDITERKRIEEAVRASERRLGLAVEAGRMAVWEFDVPSDSVQGSPELNRLLGFPEGASPTVAQMRERYYPGEQERLRAIALEALSRGERYFEAEYRYVWPDGDVRWLLLRAEIILGPDLSPRTVVGVVLDITERKRAEERQHLLINELNHRVKNTLATVQAIARQTFRPGAEAVSAYDAFEARLLALSRATDVLTRQTWEAASLAEIVEEAVSPHRSQERDRFTIAGAPVMVSARKSIALSMALHELCTNAAKYGALSVPTGGVTITWSVASDPPTLAFRWTEHGGPPVREPTRRGFGSRLIERSLRQDLGGTVDLSFAPEGVTCAVRAPLSGEAGEGGAGAGEAPLQGGPGGAPG